MQRAALSQLCKIYGVNALRNLSQNFIFDQNVTRAIVRDAAIRPGSLCIEIGPGPQGLTRNILEAPEVAKLIAFEVDKRVEPILKPLEESHEGRFNVVFDDANNMQCHFKPEYLQYKSLTVIGNLPFNIATPLLVNLLRMYHSKQGFFAIPDVQFVLMFQREVAEMICTVHGHKKRKRLSALSQTFMNPKVIRHVRSSVFVPRPKVDAAVVKFTPRKDQPEIINFKGYDSFIMRVFRKKKARVQAAVNEHLTKYGVRTYEEYWNRMIKDFGIYANTKCWAASSDALASIFNDLEEVKSKFLQKNGITEDCFKKSDKKNSKKEASKSSKKKEVVDKLP